MVAKRVSDLLHTNAFDQAQSIDHLNDQATTEACEQYGAITRYRNELLL